MLATWLYVSTSLLGSDADAEIVGIRHAAERRNPELGLTGVLIFSGHHFAQFLEGPHDGLDVMKTSIFGDARHAAVLTCRQTRLQADDMVIGRSRIRVGPPRLTRFCLTPRATATQGTC